MNRFCFTPRPKLPPLTGTVAGVTILRPVIGLRSGSVRIGHSCGHEETIESYVLRRLERLGQSRRCLECRHAAHLAKAAQPRPRGNPAKTCANCNERGHYSPRCPMRPKRIGCACRECEGLPWRRDERGCFGCEQQFAEEPPLTLADISERPVDDRRTLP